jgi:hypothetical protein
MARRLHRAVHRLEVNRAPLSDVITEGTPNYCIHPEKRAAAQSAAAMLLRGIASGQRVDLSTTVKR